MADRRDQIRMSDNELWTFVGSAAHLQVATLNLAPISRPCGSRSTGT